MVNREASQSHGLLFLCSRDGSAGGKSDKVRQLAEVTGKAGLNNIAFVCNLLLGELDECVRLLTSTDRLPEAALFARTYIPSLLPDVVGAWKAELAKVCILLLLVFLPSYFCSIYPLVVIVLSLCS